MRNHSKDALHASQGFSKILAIVLGLLTGVVTASKAQTAPASLPPVVPNNLQSSAAQLAVSEPLPATGNLRVSQILSLTETKAKADQVFATTAIPEDKMVANEISERSTRQMKMVDDLLLSQFRVQIANGLDVTSPHLFQVAIELTREGSNAYSAYLCGGTLVGASWVLTAFHCAPDPAHPSDVWVWAGSQYLQGGNANGKVVQVDKVVIYPAPYNSLTGDNDLALLHLATSQAGLPTVRLRTTDNVSLLATSQQQLTLLGWGVVNTQVVKSNNLKYAYLVVQPDSQCTQEYSGTITADSFCAGSIQIGACAGDSGGPLLEQDGSNYIQDGIVSQIDGSCGSTAALFTKVSTYATWINSQISAPVQ